MLKREYRRIFFAISLVWLVGCGKQNDWLDKPRTKNDVIFRSLKDFQDLLNNTTVFNSQMLVIGQLGTDNYYINPVNVASLPVIERNSYLWSKDILEGRNLTEYAAAYQVINNVNVILEYIEKIEITPNEKSKKDDIIGQAKFFRALAYFELSSLFCKPYNTATATVDKGLCLKLSADINHVVKRSTVAETYNQILDDAIAASNLLNWESQFKTRPNKLGAWALLSRIYLNMGDFSNSLKYADTLIAGHGNLEDFNTMPNLNLPFRFPDFHGRNAEVIYYGHAFSYATLLPGENINTALVDTVLLSSYTNDDLRKKFYFFSVNAKVAKFKGGYTGSPFIFSGLAFNEVYFNRAECKARLNDLAGAVADLNFILRKRFLQGRYSDFESSDPIEILDKILLERRKEMPFTGQIRWQDLRRLNQDPRLATIIIRKYLGGEVSLEPNSPKYVYPFPQNEIDLSGIEQNER